MVSVQAFLIGLGREERPPGFAELDRERLDRQRRIAGWQRFPVVFRQAVVPAAQHGPALAADQLRLRRQLIRPVARVVGLAVGFRQVVGGHAQQDFLGDFHAAPLRAVALVGFDITHVPCEKIRDLLGFFLHVGKSLQPPGAGRSCCIRTSDLRTTEGLVAGLILLQGGILIGVANDTLALANLPRTNSGHPADTVRGRPRRRRYRRRL